MKQTRLKRASRILSVYRYNFGITPPYKVVMDGTYAQAALTEKLNLSEQLPKYLAGPVELFTTKCCMSELDKLGPTLRGALSICKLQQIAKCPHQPHKGAAECLAHLARRSKKKGGEKYIFATQDPSLTEKLRELAGIPILYIAYKTVLLDPVSEATKTELDKPDADVEAIKELKKNLLGDTENKKKKRKKKGVNPLSCKKKIVKGPLKTNEGNKTASGKRRRKKKTTVEEGGVKSTVEGTVAVASS